MPTQADTRQRARDIIAEYQRKEEEAKKMADDEMERISTLIRNRRRATEIEQARVDPDSDKLKQILTKSVNNNILLQDEIRARLAQNRVGQATQKLAEELGWGKSARLAVQQAFGRIPNGVLLGGAILASGGTAYNVNRAISASRVRNPEFFHQPQNMPRTCQRECRVLAESLEMKRILQWFELFLSAFSTQGAQEPGGGPALEYEDIKLCDYGNVYDTYRVVSDACESFERHLSNMHVDREGRELSFAMFMKNVADDPQGLWLKEWLAAAPGAAEKIAETDAQIRALGPAADFAYYAEHCAKIPVLNPAANCTHIAEYAENSSLSKHGSYGKPPPKSTRADSEPRAHADSKKESFEAMIDNWQDFYNNNLY
jgi:hypothetical protein